jgi:DNA-binding response OmpR family regulator
MKEEQESASSGLTQNGAHSRQPSVLLVEDDRSVRRYLEVTLQRSGYKVVTASDGLEAMKLALSTEIDAVVTDAIMPHLSGQQLAAFLRGNPKLARTPIILLTGQENKPSSASHNDLIDAFLCKPVNTHELIQCLETLLKR